MEEYSTIEEAEQWIKETLWGQWAPTLTEIFSKGEDRKIAFVAFKHRQERGEAIKLLRKCENDNIWAKEDMEPQKRVCRIALLGMRWTRKKWGFAKVESNYTALAVGSETVIIIGVKDHKITYTWTPAWENWVEFQQDAEIQETLQKTSELISKSSNGKSKCK